VTVREAIVLEPHASAMLANDTADPLIEDHDES
jgi:hypothetical protein